jgi:hypothetical protein
LRWAGKIRAGVHCDLRGMFHANIMAMLVAHSGFSVVMDMGELHIVHFAVHGAMKIKCD